MPDYPFYELSIQGTLGDVTPASTGINEFFTTSRLPPLPTNEEEEQIMTTTTTVSAIIVPDVAMVRNYFTDCNFQPSFLTSVPQHRSYLHASSTLLTIAGLVNTTMGWSGTPQGSSYWSNVHRNLSTISRLLEHSHRMVIDPMRYTPGNYDEHEQET